MVDVAIKCRLQFNLFECTVLYGLDCWRCGVEDALPHGYVVYKGGWELFAVVNAIQAIANYNVRWSRGGLGVGVGVGGEHVRWARHLLTFAQHVGEIQ